MQKDTLNHKVGGSDNTILFDSIKPDSSISYSDGVEGVMSQPDSLLVQPEMHASESDLRHEGVRMPFTIEQTDGVFGLLLICFLFFTHIYNGGVNFLTENIKLLFSFKGERRSSYRQITARETLYSYFLIFQSVALISICLYDVLVAFYPLEQSSLTPLFTILMFMVLIALFLGVKDSIYRLLGYIFDTRRQMLVWRQKSVIAIEVLGILYFIPTLLLLYANVYSLQILVFMVLLFLIVQITLFYQIIIFFIEEKFNFLYLIAYLCTFEILPYIFLFIGMVYLYRIDVLNIL